MGGNLKEIREEEKRNKIEKRKEMINNEGKREGRKTTNQMGVLHESILSEKMK